MQPLKLYLKNDSSNHIRTCVVKPNSLIVELKDLVEGMYGVPRDRQLLYFRQGYLTDGYRLLNEYGISDNSLIELHYRLPNKKEKAHISIHTYQEKTVVLNLYSTSTIKEVKDLFCDKENYPREQLNLLYNGVCLDTEYYTLDDYGIVSKATFSQANSTSSLSVQENSDE